MEDFVMKLGLREEIFNDTIRDSDFVLQRLLGNMREKGATEGSMTLKIDVSFDEETIPNYDPDIEGENRLIEKPKFKHTVSSTVTIKDKKTGNTDTEMEMVFDEDAGEYILKPIANTAQKTIFDDDIWEGMQGPEEEDNGSEGDLEDPEDLEDLEDMTDEILGDDDYDYEDPEDEE